MCECGHSRNEHLGGGARQCMDEDCECDSYVDEDDRAEREVDRWEAWHQNIAELRLKKLWRSGRI